MVHLFPPVIPADLMRLEKSLNFSNVARNFLFETVAKCRTKNTKNQGTLQILSKIFRSPENVIRQKQIISGKIPGSIPMLHTFLLHRLTLHWPIWFREFRKIEGKNFKFSFRRDIGNWEMNYRSFERSVIRLSFCFGEAFGFAPLFIRFSVTFSGTAI